MVIGFFNYRGPIVKTKLTNKTRTNLKLISIISMSAFSLVAVVTACVAWFSNNKNTDGSGIAGNVDDEVNGSFSGLTLHRCINNESTETVLKFQEQDSGAQTVYLDYYSQLNTSQPILMLFKMQPGGVAPAGVQLSVKSLNPQPYSVIDTEDETAPNYYNSFSLSSAVQFRVIAYTADEFDTTTEDTFNFVCEETEALGVTVE